MLVGELRSHISQRAAKKKKKLYRQAKGKNSAPPNQIYKNCLKNFSGLKTQGRRGITKTDPKKIKKW